MASLHRPQSSRNCAGAASGIGKHLSRHLVEHGRSSKPGYPVKADVTKRDNVVDMFRNAGVAALGFPDNPGRPDVSPITVNIVGIVVTASQSSLHPFGGEPVYTASKHGVLGLVRTTALRTEHEKIFIKFHSLSAVGPGSTSSALMPPEIEAGMNARGWKVSKDTNILVIEFESPSISSLILLRAACGGCRRLCLPIPIPHPQ
ncbi:hypothetical protein B0H13DRAFT_1876681 [Mycena leptocephala]|nr:hypothetical protein B0H13DRAFT_1876681 [Mycena leptocephala]